MSKTLLIKNARVVVTMDEQRREIDNGAIFVRDNVIEQVGPTAELPQSADEVIDAAGHVVMPGLVNTHHHMYQSLTRVIPTAQNGELFNWLTNLYPIWANLDAEMVHVSTLTAMSELILSGCTTSSDHLYIYPNDCRLDDSIEAASKIGMRFHAARGSMSVGQSKGGLPPDCVVEDEKAILRDTQRLIETYHDAERHAMQRIVVAPCSPFSVSRDLMKEAAALARSHGVSLHTHLAENVNDIAYSREKFNMTPAEYAEDCDWVGHDVWHAHCVQLDEDGVYMFARTGTGVAHCPCSNMRLASGIAPVRKMVDAGVPVGLGVDGSASNDGAHMLGEVRQAMLLQRVGFGPDAMTARQALELATLGGAKVLNRDDIGALKPGMSADIVTFKLDQIGFAGALHDPVAALVFCTPANVSYSIINGKVVVKDSILQTIDLPLTIERHNRLAADLALATNSRKVAR
ncbi:MULTISPECIES: 8-oxoguanine deaminase [unclassified Duganella]|uniref:8-oxoguanine deaminase n=1 Tax=unclassified Duganella TaxID=2636909 RepID=UPI0006FD4D18|nr:MULTISPECIES: 8-oxoguanine deaminase [unclassified Duganella]KQV61677.1 hydroxydechloroatrazine ethylaminohydrolase [Duganella sp. Root336D2]KRB84185.1 hydroxydechloroatrazine ethylaminohydrolase [Duganella sp. Root198D2]